MRNHGPSLVGRHFPDEGKEFGTVFQRKLFHDFDDLELVPDMRLELIPVSHFVFANQLIVNQGTSGEQIFHWVREVRAENVE